ncbi:hypothetical protein SLA2020_339540 [Shorea laevis]
MELTILYKPNPLLFCSAPLTQTSQSPILFKLPTKHRLKISRQRPTFRVLASANPNGSDGFSWLSLTRSVRRGSERFWSKLGQVSEGVRKGGAELERFRTDLVPEFVSWNRWERWKDLKTWEPQRIGALILYIFLVVISCQRIYIAVRAPYLNRQKKELTEAYMEALIPEPSPSNVRKFKKSIWRKTMPKGLKMKKFIEGPDGTLIHDSSYVGEDAWDDDREPPPDNVKQIIESDVKLNAEEKKELKEDLGISGEAQESRETWRERLHTWKEILRKEKSAWAIRFHKCQVFFTEDLKRLYVTMKEGFPLEYVVDIPLDPYLFEIISSSGVEVDLLQKRQIHYFMKVVMALVPGILILWLIRESVMLLHVTSKRFLYKKYNQLFDMAYAENFILPVGDVGETKSMYKEVVLGGDVWDLLDELMIYMGNPMQYYEKGVKFVRGVLLSGPPGTGKTLLQGHLQRKVGCPLRNAPSFVFVDEIDAIAGRHARKDPRRRATFEALIAQLDGNESLGGQSANEKSKFLDQERRYHIRAFHCSWWWLCFGWRFICIGRKKLAFDRFSLRQAVIFICATNRPDELDLEFVRTGRIDRRLYIGLPDAKQRVQIFGVHSAGKQLAEDVDFEKLVFRTVGFSGADIRNLVNEAAIMSVRKGHSKIYQQDIVDVLDKQLLEGMGVLLTEEEQQKCEQSVSFEKKRLLAVHEAGHILLAHLFPRFDWHAFSQLLPGGKETAISVFYPREDMVDQGYTTFGYMKMQIVVAHGGRCAERVVFGDDITDGGRDDLEKITKIAREMLIRYRWDDPQVIPANMTLEVSELFTRELTRYIEEAEELAICGLRDNRHILDMITKELLEKSRITGLEVEEKMKGLSPVMFEDFVKPFQINLEEEGPLPHKDQLRYQPLDIYPAPLHRC